LPTRDLVLLWLAFLAVLLSLVTTPPSLTYPTYFFQLAAALLLGILLFDLEEVLIISFATRIPCSTLS